MSNSVFITPNGFTNNGSTINPGAPIALPDGAVGAPSLTFASGLTDGLWHPSVGYVGFAGLGVGVFTAHNDGGGVQGLRFAAASQLSWATALTASSDVILSRDAANILALKNSTNLQTFRIYDSSGTGYTAYSGTGIGTYKNIATVSNGVPSEVATIDSTGLTANVGATTLYTVPASGVGMYRVSAYLVTTVAGSVSSTMPNAQVVFTDNDSNTSVTLDVSPILGAAGLGQSGLLAANAIGTVFSGTVDIYVKASTTIQYQTINYASTAAGMAYSLRLKLEAL